MEFSIIRVKVISIGSIDWKVKKVSLENDTNFWIICRSNFELSMLILMLWINRTLKFFIVWCVCVCWRLNNNIITRFINREHNFHDEYHMQKFLQKLVLEFDLLFNLQLFLCLCASYSKWSYQYYKLFSDKYRVFWETSKKSQFCCFK